MGSSTPYRSRGAAGLGSALLAASLCLMSPSSGVAQDPFQSAPAPAPLVRPAPPPRVQAPRAQRPVYRRESEPEPAAVIPPAAPAPPIAQAPSPPEPPSLAGRWMGSNNCPISIGFEVVLIPMGREQYSVSEPRNSSTAGWVSGKLVHWQGLSLGVQFVSDGTITSATTMTGKVSGFGITCDWWATKN